MRGKLHGAHSEAVHLADHGGIAVEIEAAFDIEHRGNPAGGVDALDVRSAARDLDGLAVAVDLFDRAIQHAHRLFGFEAGGIVVLGDENGEEEGAETTLAGAGQVELAVGFAKADIAAVIELAVHGVDVAVEYQSARVQGARALRDRRINAVDWALSSAATAARNTNPRAGWPIIVADRDSSHEPIQRVPSSPPSSPPISSIRTRNTSSTGFWMATAGTARTIILRWTWCRCTWTRWARTT